MTDCFCHMHLHSTNSFKDGLSPVEDLVQKAADLGQPGMALTDHGVLFGAPALFKACAKHGIKGVIGMEAYEAVPHTFDMERDGAVFKVKWADLAPGQDRYYHLTLWALNDVGWRNLCALHSHAWSSAYHPTVRGKPLLDRASLEAHSEGIAVGLGCIASRTNQLLIRGEEEVAYQMAKWYADTFPGRVWMEVMGNLSDQQALIRPQRKLAARLGVPCLATNDVHYADQADGAKDGPHHILVQARAFKKASTEVSTDKADDGFGQWYGSDGFYLKSAAEMLATGGMTAADLEQSLALLDLVTFDTLPIEPAPPIAPVPVEGANPEFDKWLAMT